MKKILLLVCLLSSLGIADCEYHKVEFKEARSALKFVIDEDGSLDIYDTAWDKVYFHASNALVLCEDKEHWSKMVEFYNKGM